MVQYLVQAVLNPGVLFLHYDTLIVSRSQFFKISNTNCGSLYTSLCLPGHENFCYFWSFFNRRLTILYYEKKKRNFLFEHVPEFSARLGH